MSCSGITILQELNTLSICQPKNITLIQQTEVIHVCATNPVSQFVPFYFEATQGQTEFTLPGVAIFVPLCAINGTAQSQAKTPVPDFTSDNDILTINGDLDEGDLVFGVIQIS